MWTYRLNDEEFQIQFTETTKLGTLLMNSISQIPTDIFNKDPYEMLTEEFEDYYKKLTEAYSMHNSIDKEAQD